MDKSFTVGLELDQKLRKIVQTIVNLGHILGLKVVAEGVESSVEANILNSINVDFLQGYYFSRPINASDLEREFLKPRKV